MTTGMRQGWQLTGGTSDAYEELLVPAIFAPWARALVDEADPQPGERVLDLACGTGVVARTAAPRVSPGGTVTGTDVNPHMLATARRVAADVPALDWREADAADLSFPDASFDVVLCQQGLQFVGDRAAAARELRRVLAPTGRLVLSVWRSADHNRGFARFADALERHAGPAGEIMRGPFALGDQDALRALLVGAGFPQVRVVIETRVCRFPSPAELLRREALSSPLVEPLGALDAGAWDALVADVEDTLADYVDDDGLALPMECHVASSRPG